MPRNHVFSCNTLIFLLCAFLCIVAASPLSTLTSAPALTTGAISPDATTASPTITSAPSTDLSQTEPSPTTSCTTMITTTCTPTPTCTTMPSNPTGSKFSILIPASVAVIVVVAVIAIIILSLVARCLGGCGVLCGLCGPFNRDTVTDEQLQRCWAQYGTERLYLANQNGVTRTLYFGNQGEVPHGWWVVKRRASRREMKACYRRVHGDERAGPAPVTARDILMVI